VAGVAEFVGRARELGELRAGIDEALAGRGGLWLLCGEPGIGKSRLAEELARGTAGASVLWGRCWEAGGAPAYWPWVQILRTLLRRPAIRQLAEAPATAAHLEPLLPELGIEREGRPLALPPEQARFKLMDAIGGLLCEAAAAEPLLLILDDLHVADPSSLALLDFLARQIGAAPLAIVGTFRDAEVQRSPLLGRIAQQGRTIALRRLDQSAAAALLAATLGAAPPHVVDTVFQRSEGNPLFLIELCRLLVAQGAAAMEPGSALAIPGSLRAAIRGRMADLSEAAREALELASVFGRELSVDQLAEAAGGDRAALAGALEEAAAAGMLVAAGRGGHRFTHILVREVIHDDLPVARRRALHFRLADALRRAPAAERDRPWSEIAHHFFAAGEEGLAPAIEAAERAARRDVDRLAFDEAMAGYSRALEALAGAADPSPERRAELMLGLGRAELRAGELDAGRATCREAAMVARELGDFDLFARAVLELGSVFRFGHSDPELAGLLQEGLDRLEDTDSSLRARVMARLAAALQPAPDSSQPIALARRAIDMARRVGDEETLLAALRAGCSTMMNIVDPRERVELNRENLALAEHRGDRLGALHGATRLALDCYELGDFSAAETAVTAVRRLVAELGTPYYAWRAPAFDALAALWQGRFADAEAAIAESEMLAARGGDPNARPVILKQRMFLFWLRGESARLAAMAPALERMYGDSRLGAALGRVIASLCLLLAGDEREALERLSPEVVDIVLAFGTRTSAVRLVELAVACADRSLAERLAGRFEETDRDQLGSGGVIGMVLYGPLARCSAQLAARLGQPGEACRWHERAIERSRELGGAPMAALGELQLGALLAGQRDPGAARAHLEEARRLGSELGMAGAAARATELLANLEDGKRARPGPGAAAEGGAGPLRRFAMERAGDAWRIECDGESLHVRDMKGLHILAMLVEQSGRELHVLDLIDARSGAIDAGDAGTLIDEQARGAYRRRAAELAEELASAERDGDLGRAARARAEREALEDELARAVGLGGRLRHAGSAAERARVNVQRRLRAAIRRIADHHPRLGRHLERSIKTGSFCSYSPE
jgi:hypothetical protein